jgi:hypothetical protein
VAEVGVVLAVTQVVAELMVLLEALQVLGLMLLFQVGQADQMAVVQPLWAVWVALGALLEALAVSYTVVLEGLAHQAEALQ